MPDRFSDPDPAEVESPPEDVQFSHRRLSQIAGCHLCDADGLIDGFQCDHADHVGAARRGMDAVRQAMGWNSKPVSDRPASTESHEQPDNHHPDAEGLK